MPAGPPVSVIVPLHNGRHLVEACLASIPDGVEVIVVDDVSSDGAPQLVAERFPTAKVLYNQANVGFGATANRGLAAASGEVRVILNSDARLVDGALEKLVAAFSDSVVGIAGPRLVFPDGSHQTSAASFPRPATVFTGAFLLNAVFRRLFHQRRFRFELGLAQRDHESDRDVDWLVGVCLAIRSSALDDLDGGFDEGYFMYAEETDLCWRARQAGWSVRYVAGATVEHVGGGSSTDPVLAARRQVQSEARFMYRAYGDRSLGWWRAARVAGAVVKLALLALPALVDSRVRRRWRWQLAALRAAAGRSWRTGLPEPARRSVLFVQITADKYGSDRALLDLVRGVSAQGWEIRVVVPYLGPLVAELESLGADVTVAPVGAPRRVYGPLEWVRFMFCDLPASTLRVARLARKSDLVHVNTAPTLGGALGAKLGRRPLVWHIRESFRDNSRAWRVYGRIMKMADVVVANSPAMVQEAEQVGLAKKLTLVSDGLDFSRLPRREGNPERSPGVVTVGRVNAVKGHEVLVEALALLRDEGLTMPATIAGDVFPGGEAYWDRLVERIARHHLEPVVSLPGFVDDVPELLRGFEIFAFPSVRPESFGYALVEAMSMGLACIASDHGGPSDIIEHGKTGLLVPPGNPRALADAIRQLHADPEYRRWIGANAAEVVRARYSDEVMVQSILDVYKRVLSGRATGRTRWDRWQPRWRSHH